MDLFEFTEMLRRQRRILVAGAILIVGVVLAFGFDYDDGIRFRAQPRSESAIQMAVVPAKFDSLASTLLNSGEVAGTAALYATILATPETAAEISEGSGVQLLEALAVTATGRDGFIGVKATAADPEGAKQAALFSFAWLEQRLAAPVTIVRPNQPLVEPTESILDQDGKFVGDIRLEASRAFAETAPGLWIGLATEQTVVRASLADAGGEVSEFTAVLEPDSDMVISLEDVFGNQLDEIAVPIPPLPGPSTVPYALNIRLDRGILFYPQATADDDTRDPELLGSHVYVHWQTLPASGLDGSAASNAPTAVGLVLLTQDPVATITGARRGPVLMLGALVGGFFGLLALAVAIDTWSGAKHQKEAEQGGQPAIAELPGAGRPRLDIKDGNRDDRVGGPGDEVRETQ